MSLWKVLTICQKDALRVLGGAYKKISQDEINQDNLESNLILIGL